MKKQHKERNDLTGFFFVAKGCVNKQKTKYSAYGSVVQAKTTCGSSDNAAAWKLGIYLAHVGDFNVKAATIA